MARKKADTQKRKITRIPARRPRRPATSREAVPQTDPGQATHTVELEQSNPTRKPFTPETLDKTVIAIPLLNYFEAEKEKRKAKPSREYEVFDVIIDLNLEYPGGRESARNWATNAINELLKKYSTLITEKPQDINENKSKYSQQYLFASLAGEAIRELVRDDRKLKKEIEEPRNRTYGPLAIYHIWPDFPIHALINRSISTVKADAAQSSFSAMGDGIVWAVLDSGINEKHPHFAMHDNLVLKAPLEHTDFTKSKSKPEDALKDAFGHGSHVAGIIAGGMRIEPGASPAGGKKGAG